MTARVVIALGGAALLVSGCGESDTAAPTYEGGTGDSTSFRDVAEKLVAGYNMQDDTVFSALRCSGKYAPLLSTFSQVDGHLEQIADGSRLSALEFTEDEQVKISDLPLDDFTQEQLDGMRPGQMDLYRSGSVVEIATADATASIDGTGETAHLGMTGHRLADGEWCVSFFEGGINGVNGW